MSPDLQSLMSLLSQAGLRFYHRLIRTLTLPNNAGPNDPAIIIGPDLPPCMQARYSAAIFFRGGLPFTGQAIDRPIKYIGLVNNNVSAQIDEGFALTDGLTPTVVCGYYAYKTTFASLAPLGSGNSVPQEFYGPIAQGGTATMNNGGGTSFGVLPSGTPTTSWALSIGGNYSPTLAPFGIDNHSAARGFIDRVDANTNSANIVAETVMLTGNTRTFYNQRAYEVIIDVDLLPITAAGSAIMFIRRNNLGGALLAITSDPLTSTTTSSREHWRTVLRNQSGADITDNFVHTLQSGTANAVREQGGANQIRYMEIRDCGAASEYPFVAQI